MPIYHPPPQAPAAEPEVGPPAPGSLDVLTSQIDGEGADADDVGGGGPEAVPEEAEPEEDRALRAALRERDVLAHSSARGVVVTLPDVLFEFGSATLTSAGRRSVRDAASVFLDEGRGRRIAVEGHTDSIGAELFNQGLSERRARSVSRVLIDAGVSEALVDTEGYGSRFPIAPNSKPDGSDDPQGRAKNRRVEIVIER
ncbi:MAG: OmpA family protein [Candidatus Binatia bacterium]